MGGLNQNPAQGRKGWGLVRTEPTCKNKHRRTILPKQTRTPPRPLALTESTWNKDDSRQRDRKQKETLSKGKATEEELKSPETLENNWRLGKGQEKTLESDVKNNPKRKGQLLRKAVREPKLSLRSIPAKSRGEQK